VGKLLTIIERHGNAMTRDQLDALVMDYLNARLEEVEHRLAMDEWRQPAPEDLGWQGLADDLLAEETEKLTEALAENDLRATLGEASELLPGAEEEQRRVLARRLLEARMEATEAERRALRGEPLGPLYRRVRGTDAAPKTPEGKPLGDVVRAYIATHRQLGKWSPNTDKSVSGILGVLVALLGEDRRIGTISKADMQELQRAIGDMPSHAVRRYPGLTPLQVLEKARAENTATPGSAPLLSVKSRNIYLLWTRTLWKWAVKHDLATANPTVVLTDWNDDRDVREQRDRFTTEQVRALLAHTEPDREKAPPLYWIPRVMLLAGARLEEVAKLRPKDIREHEGVLVFDLNQEAGRLKNAKSVRLIPVHPELVKLGILKLRDQVAGSGAEVNLWGESKAASGRWGTKLSKRLNARLDQAGVKGSALVMESARNTFAARLAEAGTEERLIAELLGHADQRGGTSMTRRYIGKARLEVLRDAVVKLSL
jgi:integrase